MNPVLLLCAALALSACSAPGASRPDVLPSDRTFDAPLVPADGRVLFFMGQDSETLAAYKSDALGRDPALPQPGGVTLYTGVFVHGDALRGLRDTVDYGAGAISFDETLAAFPGAALAVGLALTDGPGYVPSTTLRALGGRTGEGIAQADVDRVHAQVEALLDYLDETGRPVFLRIGYEFDGPWNGYRPEAYRAAFRYVARRVRARGLDQIATVWQSAAAPIDQDLYRPTDPGHFDAWYPGDDVVDWVGLSVFNPHPRGVDPYGCMGDDPLIDPADVRQTLLDFARSHDKPVMIGEAAPQGYDTGALTAGCYNTRAPTAVSADRLWETWYAPFFNTIEANRDVVRAVAYINTDWDGQSMWQCAAGASAGDARCPSGYWGDSRVQAHPDILQRFARELRRPLYIQP